LSGQRWDPNYAKHMAEFVAKLKGCSHPVRKLKEFLSEVQYGISERATAENVGVPMLRMLNLQERGWTLADLKYIAMSDAEMEPYLLNKGDILFNRTNSKELVGKCSVFDLEGKYVFASYLMRVSLKPNVQLIPEFVVAYIASSLGRIQIDAVSRQIAGMTNINAEEVRELLIPVPSQKIQERISKRVAALRAQALALREQAHTDFEMAKRDIEVLILGGKESA
jgi:type I restriction enzyme, S subunit